MPPKKTKKMSKRYRKNGKKKKANKKVSCKGKRNGNGCVSKGKYRWRKKKKAANTTGYGRLAKVNQLKRGKKPRVVYAFV